jgi:hypothetical protein
VFWGTILLFFSSFEVGAITIEERRCYMKFLWTFLAVVVTVNLFVGPVRALFSSTWDRFDSANGGHSSPGHYTREFLLSLQSHPLSSVAPSIDFDLSETIKTQGKKKKKKKRGSRGGVRNRLRRRGSRLPLPTV